jgi:hypothetical protein
MLSGFPIFHTSRVSNYPKIFFFTNGSPKGGDGGKTCFKKVGFSKPVYV